MKARYIVLLILATFGIMGGRANSAEVDDFLERKPPPQRESVRYEVQGEAQTRFNSGTSKQSFVLKTACVRDGDRISTQTIRWDNDQPKLAWCSFVNKWYIAYEMAPAGAKPQRCFYAADGRGRIGDMFTTGLGIFDGHLPDEAVSLQEVVRSSSNREMSAEQVDGHDCLKLTVDHATYGHYILWLDPKAGYTLRKLLVSKLGMHSWQGHKLEDWIHMSPQGSTGKIHLKSMSLAVDSIVLDQASGRWDAAAWRSTLVQEYSDGNGEQVVHHGKRTGIHLGAPPLDRDFTPAIAEHTLLINLNDSQLPFEWTSGGPKPWVDRQLVASMESAAAALRSAMNISGNQR